MSLHCQLEIASPIGPLFLVASVHGLSGVYWQMQDVPMLASEHKNEASSHLFEAAEQLHAYLAGERTDFTVPLAINGTPFQREVWGELQKIPYGKTISYSELATRVNRPKAFRAVGTANGRNPLSLIIPCHRVIASDASLGGYSGGLDRKSWLLRLEMI